MAKLERLITPVRCREFGETAKLLEQVCPHCAAQQPVEIINWLTYLILGLTFNTVLTFLT
jgi:hypothetical protein